jgi:hypothetical protein
MDVVDDGPVFKGHLRTRRGHAVAVGKAEEIAENVFAYMPVEEFVGKEEADAFDERILREVDLLLACGRGEKGGGVKEQAKAPGGGLAAEEEEVVLQGEVHDDIGKAGREVGGMDHAFAEVFGEFQAIPFYR